MQDFSDDSVFLAWNWIENSVVVSPEIYWSFFKFFPAWFSKSFSRCREELFEDKVSWNFLSFHVDFQNWAKRFWNLGPKFGRYCQCCIINSLRNFLMINFSGSTNLFCISSVWLEFLLTFYGNLSAGLPKLHFAFLDEDFEVWNFFF